MITARDGRAFLNLGCGLIFRSDWNNLDIETSSKEVRRFNVRKPLPFPAGTFDVVYMSHLLEHLNAADGRGLVKESHRVLKDGGTVRIAVPDLEQNCRQYLTFLEEGWANPADEKARFRYRWGVAELIDQLVREVPGGQISQLIRSQSDMEFLRARLGDQLEGYLPPPANSTAAGSGFLGRLRRKSPAQLWQSLKYRFLKLRESSDPRQNGEAHKWMYDRLSLKLLLEDAGFERYSVVRFDESRIPGWETMNLDRAPSGDRVRKPDSIFVEASKMRN
jgi:SAM-dependent methyltransferase